MELERDSGKLTLSRNWETDKVTVTDVANTGGVTTLSFSVGDAETLAEWLTDLTRD